MNQMAIVPMQRSNATGIFLLDARLSGSNTVSTVSLTRTLHSHSSVMDRYDVLLAEVTALRSRVAALEGMFEVIEELDWETALSRGRELFKTASKPLYPTEVADALKTSVSQAIEVCEALELEGSVEGKAEEAGA